MCRTKVVALLCALCSLSFVRAQAPEVGKPCPPFLLSYVTHYAQKQVTLNSFKGKWLFLDFWFTGCSSCLKSFPKISKLQQDMAKDIQFMLVGYNSQRSEKNIVETFEKLRERQGLNLASAYDSVLANDWGISSMPHVVVVDPQGIVRFITSGFDITTEKLKDLVAGKPVKFEPKDVPLPPFDVQLANKDKSLYPQEKILSHSIFTKWNGEQIDPGYDIGEYAGFTATEMPDFRLARVTLEWLYSIAYLGKPSGLLKFWGEPLYGQVYPYPVYELKDSSEFQTNWEVDPYKGFYNYSLRVPRKQLQKENLMHCMQQDLERVFGYVAVVEERDMPVWKLVAQPGAAEKLKTKGGKPYYDAAEGKSIVMGFTVKNTAMKDYLMYVCYYVNEKERHPFIDATGITHHIDLTIDADLTNMDALRKELQKNGLDLQLSTKKMKTLVIRNARP